MKELCTACKHLRLFHFGASCRYGRCKCDGFVEGEEYRDQERLTRAARGHAIGTHALAEAMARSGLVASVEEGVEALRETVR